MSANPVEVIAVLPFFELLRFCLFWSGSCSICSTMKVKCDGMRPCSRCVHNHRGDKCHDREFHPRKSKALLIEQKLQERKAALNSENVSSTSVASLLSSPSRDVDSLVSKAFSDSDTFERSFVLIIRLSHARFGQAALANA